MQFCAMTLPWQRPQHNTPPSQHRHPCPQHFRTCAPRKRKPPDPLLRPAWPPESATIYNTGEVGELQCICIHTAQLMATATVLATL